MEEDLAAVFGRMRIEPNLEKHFRDAVKITALTELFPKSEVLLKAGPGPTLARGLQDSYYMSTIIQLSYLAWTCEHTSLASSLVECMRNRSEAGVKTAVPSLSYDGTVAVLKACNS